MEQKQIQSFTEGKIFSPLIRFALPVLFAMLLQTMYGAVDLLIVGQLGGDMAQVAVSAVATGSQIMHAPTVIIMGLSMGLTVFVGRELGAGRREKAGRIIGSGIWLFGLMALVLTAVMIFAAPFLARTMRAPEEALSQTISYIVICSVGTLFIVAYNLVGSVFRGLGDSKIPLLTVAIACVLNIIGDLILVAVFHMGAAGAAVATVIAQAFSVVLSLLIIRRRELPFTFSIKDVRPHRRNIRTILKLGIPIAFQDLLVNISFLVVLSIINSLGLTASAGVGVSGKLTGFLMLVPASFMQSMSAFVAQNMGAGKPERARRALLCGIGSSLAVSVVTAYFVFFHGSILAGIFAKDTQIILAAADYMRAYALDCLLTSFLFCFTGYFNGCSQTTFVMLQGIIGAFCVRIPVSWIMSQKEVVSLFGIGIATPASSLLQIVLCGIYFVVLLHRQRRAEQAAVS